ncbi:MAG: hypothetical protein QW568_00935 [Candidatus Anstonellaceae archaeon]
MLQAQATSQVQAAKKAPVPMYKLLPYADNILDLTSSKPDKKGRANIFYEELRELQSQTLADYNAERKKDAPDKERLAELQKTSDYVSALFAHICNLTNSFQSMQEIWHAKVNEITVYSNSKIAAGNVWENLKKWAPWLAGPAVAVGAVYTGAWNDLMAYIDKTVSKDFVNLAKAAADFFGLGAMAAISAGISKLSEWTKHRIRQKRDEKLQVFFKEEGKVRDAIRGLVQQIGLGLAAEFGYESELKSSGDETLLNKSQSNDIAGIWKLINHRISQIRSTVPESIRDFFPASLNLPEYVSGAINGDVSKPEQASAQQPSSP